MEKQMNLCLGDEVKMKEKYNAIKAGTDPDFILYGDSGYDAAVDMMGSTLTDDERDYL